MGLTAENNYHSRGHAVTHVEVSESGVHGTFKVVLIITKKNGSLAQNQCHPTIQQSDGFICWTLRRFQQEIQAKSGLWRIIWASHVEKEDSGNGNGQRKAREAGDAVVGSRDWAKSSECRYLLHREWGAMTGVKSDSNLIRSPFQIEVERNWWHWDLLGSNSRLHGWKMVAAWNLGNVGYSIDIYCWMIMCVYTSMYRCFIE